MVTISDLPSELLELCLPSDVEWVLRTGILVCKSWKWLLLSIPRFTFEMDSTNFQLLQSSACHGIIQCLTAKKFSFWSGSLLFGNFLNSLKKTQRTLRHLDLSYSNIDAQCLHAGLRAFPSSLVSVKLDCMWIEDISMLRDCTLLQELSLSRTKVRDISPIIKLTSLVKLDIGWTPVENASAIQALTNLENLGMSFILHGNQCLQWLENLTKLHTLCLSGSQLARIYSPRSVPNRIRALDLAFNDISNCEFLSHMGSQIHFLGLGGNSNLRSIRPVGQFCSYIGELVVSGTQVYDLTSLAFCSRLEKLNISCTPVIDLSPLSAVTTLVRLDMISCAVASLAPLASCQALEILRCETNKANYNFKEISGCLKLRSVSLSAKRREEIQPIGFVPKIVLNGLKIVF